MGGYRKHDRDSGLTTEGSDAAWNGVPRGEETVPLTYEVVNPGTTASILGPSDQMQARMAHQGVRYGNPELPRYATGRVDGKAPSLKWRTRNPQ